MPKAEKKSKEETTAEQYFPVDEDDLDYATEKLVKENIQDKDSLKYAIEKEVKDKPKEMRGKILEGKLDAHFKDKVLLEQDFIKDPSKKISTLVEEGTQKFGEKIEIGKFTRFSI